jgi:hypothetical protein
MGLKGVGLGKGPARGKGAVDSQHRTRVEGGSHHALKTTTPSNEIFAFENIACKYCTLYIIVQYCMYFSSLQVNNKPSEGVMTSAFMFGLFSMVVNTRMSLYLSAGKPRYIVSTPRIKPGDVFRLFIFSFGRQNNFIRRFESII